MTAFLIVMLILNLISVFVNLPHFAQGRGKMSAEVTARQLRFVFLTQVLIVVWILWLLTHMRST